MRRLRISELRSHLSKYLKEVRRGDEIVIMDRDSPVARLVRIGPADTGESEAEALARLSEQGTVSRPRRALPREFFAAMPSSRRSVVQALLDEREEGR